MENSVEYRARKYADKKCCNWIDSAVNRIVWDKYYNEYMEIAAIEREAMKKEGLCNIK